MNERNGEWWGWMLNDYLLFYWSNSNTFCLVWLFLLHSALFLTFLIPSFPFKWFAIHLVIECSTDFVLHSFLSFPKVNHRKFHSRKDFLPVSLHPSYFSLPIPFFPSKAFISKQTLSFLPFSSLPSLIPWLDGLTKSLSERFLLVFIDVVGQ